MSWGTEQNNAAIPIVLKGGVEQFLSIYNGCKDVENSPFLWGDELEHALVEEQVDPVTGKTVLKLALDAAPTLQILTASSADAVDWRPEYGSFMVESVPNYPYGVTAQSLGTVEGNMRQRYMLVDQASATTAVANALPPSAQLSVSTSAAANKLVPKRYGLTLVTFPLMGQGSFTNHPESTESPHSQSLFVPDLCINQTHPRFSTLTANIRKRRTRKVCIQIPIFMDKFTLERTIDPKLNIDFTPRNKDISCKADSNVKKGSKFGAKKDEPAPEEPAVSNGNGNGSEKSASEENMQHLYTPATNYYYAQYSGGSTKKNLVEARYEACPCPTPSVSHPCIYMDCMAFGMGCNCLQVTMQMPDVNVARHIYDQLVVLCPPFLAVTSATPFQKGLLCDSDVRWLTIAASVDDRKRSEVPRILKSRYDNVSAFISNKLPAEKINALNDNHVEINQETFEHLKAAGLDEVLAQHVAHMFIRDPLVIFDQAIEIDNQHRSDHFESIQSTNWQTVRFKPPPPNSNIGWRVEFRIMDISPTPFENAAMSVFVALLTRAIMKYDLVFYTKMSLVDENMGRAHIRDPCTQKYAFRKDPFVALDTVTDSDDEVAMLSVDEIFNGSDAYVGLIPIVRKFVADELKIDLDADAAGTETGGFAFILRRYLNFIGMRASGKITTVATYWRNFITAHPDYKQDSRITDDIALDIARRCKGLQDGTIQDDAYLPFSNFNAPLPALTKLAMEKLNIVGQKRTRNE